MKAERPIIFSAPMVRKIIANKKTQTRRTVSPANSLVNGCACPRGFWEALDFSDAFVDSRPSPAGNPGPYLKVGEPEHDTLHRVYPRIQVGDTLWVRERFSVPWDCRDEPLSAGAPIEGYPGAGWPVWYWADGQTPDPKREGEYEWFHNLTKPRSPIHMPRWASRLTLRVTDVRVERLQEITPDDAIAEGMTCWVCKGPVDGTSENDCACFHTKSNAVPSFQVGWDTINGGRCPWASNPWVWVVAFERVA